MISAYSYAIFAAFFWGAGFIGSRFGLEGLSPMWVTFFRFLVAFIVALPTIATMKIKHLKWKMFLGAFICAVILACMMFLQIKGLQYTTVAKSGFITILYAFFTPILCLIFYRKKLSGIYWSLMLLALIGMMLICELSFANFNKGDLLTLICALFSSFHILAINHFSKFIKNFSLFNLLQMFFVCLISFPLAIALEGSEIVIKGQFLNSSHVLSGILFMGIFSTSIAFFLQGKSQQKIPPHMASLIFLLESPFAAIMAFVIFQEVMSNMAIIGSLLVVLTVALLPLENHLAKCFRALVLNVASKVREGLEKVQVQKVYNYILLFICFLTL